MPHCRRFSVGIEGHNQPLPSTNRVASSIRAEPTAEMLSPHETKEKNDRHRNRAAEVPMTWSKAWPLQAPRKTWMDEIITVPDNLLCHNDTIDGRSPLEAIEAVNTALLHDPSVEVLIVQCDGSC